jgi:hypothetical protein
MHRSGYARPVTDDPFAAHLVKLRDAAHREADDEAAWRRPAPPDPQLQRLFDAFLERIPPHTAIPVTRPTRVSVERSHKRKTWTESVVELRQIGRGWRIGPGVNVNPPTEYQGDIYRVLALMTDGTPFIAHHTGGRLELGEERTGLQNRRGRIGPLYGPSMAKAIFEGVGLSLSDLPGSQTTFRQQPNGVTHRNVTGDVDELMHSYLIPLLAQVLHNHGVR